MHRLVWAALLLAACGESMDDRPLELEYLTQAILAPSCGATQCHSTFKQAGNYVFDTPEAARRTIVDEGLIRFDSSLYDPDMPTMARLIIWVTEIDPEAAGIGRMPFDAPLPNADVELLKEWISVQAPGAQCNPEKNSGKACNNNEVVECSADWTFGPRVQLCTNGCALGTCL
jgi:hypothetical protein